MLAAMGGALLFGQQAPAPDAVFRTATKLVQVSVIAQNKAGLPVADLRREEFQLFDNGIPQETRLFLTDLEGISSQFPEAKFPEASSSTSHSLTNLVAPSSTARTSYSVILIDNLFTGFGDPMEHIEGTGLARVQTLKMLKALPPGEHVAIYAVGRKLQIICEFTSDRDLLERQLRKWKPDVDTPETSQLASAFPMPVGGVNPFPHREDAAAEAERIDALERVSSNDEAMGQIADHLTGIPGRKNLIWLSRRFVVNPRVLAKFDAANVAMYPVDVDGVCRLCPPPPKDQMRAIARATGGVAYFERNDLDIAMRQAISDGRASYELGFYQPDGNAKPGFHQILVRVNRPGVTLRYRTAYQVDPPASPQPSIQDLIRAMNRPVDATAIILTATATRSQDRLTLSAAFDVSGLDLQFEDGRWKGSAELAARFTTAEGGQAGDVVSETVTLNLKPETYAAATQTYRGEFTIPPKAVELKLLLGNLTTGKIGTLTIPLSKIEAAK